ncbi:MAG: hypothetical protein ACXAEU_22465 [Candidatus Hodarchaeales archaeon]
MTGTFLIDFVNVQPTQLYISEKKLTKILEIMDSNGIEAVEPPLVKKLGSDLVFTDGHTRAFAMYRRGYTKLQVSWDDDEWDTGELDREMYSVCAQWCKNEKIYTIADLEKKVISSDDYQVLWLDRCHEMQEKINEKSRY